MISDPEWTRQGQGNRATIGWCSIARMGDGDTGEADGQGLPTGTVTFLFTDVEGSTRLWQEHPTEMAVALELHDDVVRSVATRHGGYVFATAGDSFAVAFHRAMNAVRASVEVQRSLGEVAWPEVVRLAVRMGLHTGEAQERAGDYFGSAVNRAARVMSLAQGDQVLVSAATHDVVLEADIGDLGLLDLGSHRLKGLTKSEILYQITGPGLRAEFGPIKSGAMSVGNLPTAIDALVGRDDDVDRVCGLLSSHRLVTIVGVGGIGKTRIALESARRMVDDHSDGAWLCELAEVGAAEAVPAVIGQAIGCRQHPGRTMTESIAEFCRNKQILLVIDNCEHVLGAVGDLVELVLGQGAGVSVLTTSREVLGSRREQAYPLGPLDSGEADSPAVELFVRRAGQIDPATVWDQPQMAAIAVICQRVDGMPLAIELAASRVLVMSPVEIEAHLDNAFRLLRGGRQSIERHRTLQAAIDWSYASLSEEERRVFQLLSVFAGSWDLEAATFIGKEVGFDEFDVLDHVGALVSKSLVLVDSVREGVSWYRLLEPLRQYAEDVLAGEDLAEAARSAHLDYYQAWAKQWGEQLPVSGRGWKTSLLDRLANLRAAVSWGLAVGDGERTSELVSSLGLAQQAFLLLEIGDWADEILKLPGIEFLPEGADCAGIAAMTHWWRDDVQQFSSLANRSLVMPGRVLDDIGPVALKSMLTVVSGDRQQAVAIMDEADRSSPVADVVVSYLKLSFASEVIDAEMERLTLLLDETQSRWVEAIICLFSARDALRRGEFEEAAAHARQGWLAAENIGATFYAHHCVFALSDALGATGLISAEDARTVVTTLREQSDAGQELDQWLVLTGLDLLLYRRGYREFAVAIRRSFRTTVWVDMRATLDLSTIPGHEELDRAAAVAPDAPDPEVAELVDSLIEILDDMAHDEN